MSPLEEQLKDLVVQSRDVLPKGLTGLGRESGLGRKPGLGNPRFKKKRKNAKK
jgi:hypothetical protein